MTRCPEDGQMLGCRKHTLMSACFFFNACRSVVGGLLLRGMSKSVVTPPTAAADVAAKMPAPTDIEAFAGIQACGLRAMTSLAVCTGQYKGHLPESMGATAAAQSLSSKQHDTNTKQSCSASCMPILALATGHGSCLKGSGLLCAA